MYIKNISWWTLYSVDLWRIKKNLAINEIVQVNDDRWQFLTEYYQDKLQIVENWEDLINSWEINSDKIEDWWIEDVDLSSKIFKDNWWLAIWYIDITWNCSDTDTITINSRVYEFDTNSTITWNVVVNISWWATATASATALVWAINWDTSRVVDAIDVWDWTVLLVAKTTWTTNFTIAKSWTNIAISWANCVWAKAPAVQTWYIWKRTITAQDVTTTTWLNWVVNILWIPKTSAPTNFLISIRNSAWVFKNYANSQFTFVQANSNFYVLQLKETQNWSTDLIAWDVITALIFE